MTEILIAIGLFCSSCMIDFAHARYVRANMESRRFHAANWSALQWCAGTVGFVVAIKIGLWLLPCEVAGLYVGTLIGVRK